ncbi:MAG: alanine--glyoxylate aminotransferase family protein [Candidatus Thermoplasmatota archaeon]
MTHKKLFIPGPTEVRKEVIEAMNEWIFGHRSQTMTDLYTTIVEDTKKFLDTDNHVIILTASGTAFMESSVMDCVDKDVLCATCGSFSERQANIADRLGKNVDRLEYEWGKAVKPDDVKEALEKKDYDAFTCVMNETSTGVRNPIEEIGQVLKDYPDTLFVIDAISCLGGDYIDIEKSNIDVIFSSVQKAFAMPPGLSVCVVNDKAYDRSCETDSGSWYGGFKRNIDYYKKKGQTHQTPAVSLMLAYRKQMKHMLEEGHKNRSKRHQEMAEYTQNWAKKHFEMFPEEGYWSQTVSTIKNTQGINIAELRKKINEKYDMVFANGYGSKLKEKTFRIGHMGDHTVESVKELTDAIEETAGL